MKKYTRCQHCKKRNTLTEISSSPQRINPFMIRSFTGILCKICGWTQKEYTFKEIVEEKE
jgi:hypothetical protein